MNTEFKFDPDWMIQVVEDAVALDPYLQNHPEIVSFLKVQLPNCKPLSVRLNGDGYKNNFNFYFVDSKNPNRPGSAWQYKTGITIYGGAADLYFDIMRDNTIGGIEVWLRAK